MFMGHLGATGLARSCISRQDSASGFLALVGAGYLPDVLDLALSAMGICSPYGLYTHTIPSIAVQVSVCAGFAWLISRSARLAIVVALVILFHSGADFFTASKLFMPGGEMHGLEFYKKPALDFVLELSVLLAGWWIVRRTQQGPRWATSVYVLLAVIALQLSFDVVIARPDSHVKPNACFHETFTIT